MSSARTPLLRLYQTATGLAGGVAFRKVARTLQHHDVDAARIAERLGKSTATRPEGRLTWFHAASVGESLSVLTLIRRLGVQHPDMSFLVTSGTATSAQLIGERLPPRTQHQFAPIDTVAAMAAFYNHWRPDAGIFVESELWPNMLLDGAARGIPLALLNARLSDKSVRGWQRWPATAKAVLSCFRILIAQNQRNLDNLIAMGAPRDRVRHGTNLKALSVPLPVDEAALDRIRSQLAGRPVWIAASTHAGEEETVLAAHKTLLARYPDLVLILIPRHPKRGAAIAGLLQDAGLVYARRTRGEAFGAGHSVYLADTLGETGTFYAAAPIVFVAGSLLSIGGHNPYEPAQAGAAILTGPNRTSFEETYTAMIAARAAKEVSDAASLARAVGDLLACPARLLQSRNAARDFVSGQDRALDRIVRTLEDALELRRA